MVFKAVFECDNFPKKMYIREEKENSQQNVG